MSKVVLVMDDPIYCANCMVAQCRKRFDKEKCFWTCGKGYNSKRGGYVWNRIDMESKTRPEWCPLKEVPEKKLSYTTSSDHLNGFASGYNACIEEILKDNDGWTTMVEADNN